MADSVEEPLVERQDEYASVSMANIVSNFVLMGWTAFGGPQAHIALFETVWCWLAALEERAALATAGLLLACIASIASVCLLPVMHRHLLSNRSARCGSRHLRAPARLRVLTSR